MDGTSEAIVFFMEIGCVNLAKFKKRAKIAETEEANSSVEEVRKQGGQEVTGPASSRFEEGLYWYR